MKEQIIALCMKIYKLCKTLDGHGRYIGSARINGVEILFLKDGIKMPYNDEIIWIDIDDKYIICWSGYKYQFAFDDVDLDFTKFPLGQQTLYDLLELMLDTYETRIEVF